ncbi:hypothetical protein HYC85_017583 [Camellia sinensis]|uniref:Uncharacterized protein n=1 Tax=Camellia sinensis TaxID=4442 RepID=A0A7J7GVG2_CAMSI|nr:hypothetical protein HYC85_017583 [Camellia sinensis]
MGVFLQKTRTIYYELPHFLGLFQSNPDDPFIPTTRSLPQLNSPRSCLHRPPTTSTPVVLLPKIVRTFFNMLMTRSIGIHGVKKHSRKLARETYPSSYQVHSVFLSSNPFFPPS